MPDRTYVILDKDENRRTDVYRSFAQQRPSIPIDTIEGLGAFWPENIWFLCHDDPDLLGSIQLEFARRGCFHPVVAYHDTLVPSRIVSAIYGGAVDYILWPTSVAVIESAEHKVTDIARRRSEEAAARIVAQSMMNTLTARELEVMREVRRGQTNKEIARNLGISPRTVEIHRSNALSKLGARNSADATRIFIEAQDSFPALHRAA